MRRAKIVCTLGPATESPEMVQALVDAGMDVARINRSHGDADAHAAVIKRVREAAEASGRAVAVLVDLQGPKIRLGRFVRSEERRVGKEWRSEGSGSALRESEGVYDWGGWIRRVQASGAREMA